MTLLNQVKSGSRAAVVALSLSAAALVAMPAQAAPPPPPMLGGHVTMGGPNAHLSIGTGGISLRFGTPDYFKACLDDRGILRLLRNAGYHFVKIVREGSNDNRHNRVYATGAKFHDFYIIRVDRCSHSFSAHKLGHNDHDNFNGFSLNFSF